MTNPALALLLISFVFEGLAFAQTPNRGRIADGAHLAICNYGPDTMLHHLRAKKPLRRGSCYVGRVRTAGVGEAGANVRFTGKHTALVAWNTNRVAELSVANAGVAIGGPTSISSPTRWSARASSPRPPRPSTSVAAAVTRTACTSR